MFQTMYIVILHSFNLRPSPWQHHQFCRRESFCKTKWCDLLGTVCWQPYRPFRGRKFTQPCSLFSTIQTKDMNSLNLIHHFNAHCQRFRRCEQFFLGWRLSKAEKTEMLFGLLLIFFKGCLFPFFSFRFFASLFACLFSFRLLMFQHNNPSLVWIPTCTEQAQQTSHRSHNTGQSGSAVPCRVFCWVCCFFFGRWYTDIHLTIS